MKNILVATEIFLTMPIAALVSMHQKLLASQSCTFYILENTYRSLPHFFRLKTFPVLGIKKIFETTGIGNPRKRLPTY